MENSAGMGIGMRVNKNECKTYGVLEVRYVNGFLRIRNLDFSVRKLDKTKLL